ncbi:unnamed protein product [Chrysoparadoxa australica]
MQPPTHAQLHELQERLRDAGHHKASFGSFISACLSSGTSPTMTAESLLRHPFLRVAAANDAYGSDAYRKGLRAPPSSSAASSGLRRPRHSQPQRKSLTAAQAQFLKSLANAQGGSKGAAGAISSCGSGSDSDSGKSHGTVSTGRSSGSGSGGELLDERERKRKKIMRLIESLSSGQHMASRTM